jgi:hypothetical protein
MPASCCHSSNTPSTPYCFAIHASASCSTFTVLSPSLSSSGAARDYSIFHSSLIFHFCLALLELWSIFLLTSSELSLPLPHLPPFHPPLLNLPPLYVFHFPTFSFFYPPSLNLSPSNLSTSQPSHFLTFHLSAFPPLRLCILLHSNFRWLGPQISQAISHTSKQYHP